MEMQKSQSAPINTRSTIPQIDWIMSRHYFLEEKKNEAPKFLGISLSAHFLALIAVTFIAIPLLQKPEVETITIEIADSAPGIRKPVPRLQEALPPKIEKEQVKELVGLVPQQQVMRHQQPHALKTIASKSPVVAKSVQPLASTLDDIQTQDLSTDSKLQSISNINPQLLDQDLDNDLLAVNQRHKKSLAREKQKLLNQLHADENAANQKLMALERANALRREKMMQANADRRAKDQAALAELRAQESADAQAAAEHAAAVAAAEAAAQREAENRALAAKQAELEQAAQRRRQRLAAAAAQDGYGGRVKANGLPAGVRDISELRQLPGNPRPQYDSNERLQGQQGQVSFLAYITKEGTISKLKPLKQTGFSNLDQKSLDAVKKWKFYPGQEGWVEIPFSWDLKGGPQEMPALLRRSVSRR